MGVHGDAPATSIETNVLLIAIEPLPFLRQLLGVGQLHLGRPVVVQLEPSVDAQNRIVGVAELPIGIEHTDARLLGNVPEGAKDTDARSLPEQRVRWIADLPGRLVVHEHRSDAPVPQPSGKPGARFGIDDAAREHELGFRAEVVGVLYEKRPQLRKPHLEALVDGDLRLVGLNLAEVRVERDVQHHAVLKDEFRVQPDIVFRVVSERRAGARIRVQHIEVPGKEERNNLNIAPGRDVPDADQGSGLIESTLDGNGVLGPIGLLATARNLALEHDAPYLLDPFGKPQRPHGYGH